MINITKFIVILMITLLIISSCSNINKEQEELIVLNIGTYSCELFDFIGKNYVNNDNYNIIFIQDEHEHDDEEHDEILINSDYFMDAYQKLINNQLQADLIISDSIMMASHVKNNLFVDLNNVKEIKTLIDNPNIFESVKKLCLYKDMFIGVPLNLFYTGLVINEEMFNEIGIKLPSMNWTFDEFYDISIQVNNFNISNNKNVYLIEAEREPDKYVNIMYGFDTSNNGKFDILSTGFMEYLKKTNEIFNYIIIDYDNHFGSSLDDDNFNKNYLFSSIIYADLHNIDSNDLENKKVLPIPLIDNRPYYLHGVMLSLSSNAKNTETAIKFIKDFFNEQYQYENAFEMQIYKDIEKYKLMSEYPIGIKNWIKEFTEKSEPLMTTIDVLRLIDKYELPKKIMSDNELLQWAEIIQKDVGSITN